VLFARVLIMIFEALSWGTGIFERLDSPAVGRDKIGAEDAALAPDYGLGDSTWCFTASSHLCPCLHTKTVRTMGFRLADFERSI